MERTVNDVEIFLCRSSGRNSQKVFPEYSQPSICCLAKNGNIFVGQLEIFIVTN